MGHLISFWGLQKGQTGNTSSFIGSAAMMGLDYETHILAAQSDTSSAVLENVFRKTGIKNEESNFNSIGYDALENLVRSGQLSPSNFKDYATPVLGNHLDILSSSAKQQSHSDLARVRDVIEKICSNALPAYDLTLFDVTSGSKDFSENEMDNQVLNLSDLIVVSLNQNKSVLENFFENTVNELQDKNYIILLGQYDQFSRWNEKNISRLFKVKKPIFVVPHNASYMDALNENKIIEFFLKRKNINKDDTDFGFINAIRNVNKGILRSIEIDHKMISREA